MNMININTANSENRITQRDLVDHQRLYEVCTAFVDHTGNLYIHADDSGNGPFWLKCSGSHFEAMSAETLDCIEPLKAVDIEIDINIK